MYDYYDGTGRLGFLWSWEEATGFKLAKMAWSGVSFLTALSAGALVSEVTHRASNPNPPKRGYVASIVSDMVSVATAPIRAIAHPIQTANQLYGLFKKHAVPHAIVDPIVDYTLNKDDVRLRAVTFLRPLMEKMSTWIAPTPQTTFQYMKEILRSALIPNRLSPDAGTTMRWLHNAGYYLGVIPAEVTKMGVDLFHYFFAPRSTAEHAAKDWYQTGQSFAKIITYPVTFIKDAYQGIKWSGPCLANEGVKPCTLKAWNFTKEHASAFWDLIKPVRNGVHEAANWGGDKIWAAAEVGSDYTNGWMTPKMVIGLTAVVTPALLFGGRLLQLKLNDLLWPRGPNQIVQNNNQNQQMGAQPAPVVFQGAAGQQAPVVQQPNPVPQNAAQNPNP